MYDPNSQKTLENFLLMMEKNKDYGLIQNRFPHIAKRMGQLWGKEELHTYLDVLIKTSKNHDEHTVGFPREIMEALFHLMNLHDDYFPKIERRFTSKSDMWDLALFGK